MILYDFELKKIAKVVVYCGIEIVREKFDAIRENKVRSKNNWDDRCLL